MKKKLLLTTALVMAATFANSNAGSTVWICATPQNYDLDVGDYEMLSWVQIKGVGNHGEGGSTTNILNYDTWDTKVMQKAKGITNAGDPEIEVARLPFDAGQLILRAAAETNFNYAFKMIRNDPETPGGDPTILYNRGLVTGPRRPFGRNEDFDLEVFTAALNQKEIVVNPTQGGTRPTLTVSPAITGTAEVGELLTCSTGTFTGTATITYAFQWYAAGAAIANATNATYTLTAAELGKVITCRVRATNLAGSAIGFAEETAAVAA